MPPFASGEFPLHELGELRSGDVRSRVPSPEEKREFVPVEGVEREEIRLIQGLDAGIVG